MELKNFNKDKLRRKPLLETSNMVFGKIPPQARDLEEAILGAIMLEKSAFDVVVEILKPECFYIEAHQKIYKAMQNLQIKNYHSKYWRSRTCSDCLWCRQCCCRAKSSSGHRWKHIISFFRRAYQH